MELVGHGIRVNSLTPTATDPAEIVRAGGALGPHGQRPESLDRIMKPFRTRIPMQKLPVPSDYGRAAALPRLGRRGDDHRHRSARRCRRHRPLLGLGSHGGSDALALGARH